MILLFSFHKNLFQSPSIQLLSIFIKLGLIGINLLQKKKKKKRLFLWGENEHLHNCTI